MSLLIFFLLLMRCSYGLLVRKINSNASAIKIEHRTGQFGPPARTYNVSGVLVRSEPQDGCKMPNVSYKGSIVLILRGQCTFGLKVLYAQSRGARGVIICDNKPQAEWISMVARGTDANATFRIPAVFVQNSKYSFLYERAVPPQTLLSHQKDRHHRRILTSNKDRWLCLLNAIGEHNMTKPMNVWRFLGYLLLFIPTVWCLVTVILVIARAIRSCVNKRRRERRLLSIPVVEYIGVEENGDEPVVPVASTEGESVIGAVVPDTDTSETKLLDAEQENASSQTRNVSSSFSSLLSSLTTRRSNRLRPHNDTCAVCLDEFEIGTSISILPCRHGYHEDCINPWLRAQSELCPMCKQSIFVSPDSNRSNSESSFRWLLKCCAGQRHGRRHVRDESEDVPQNVENQMVLVSTEDNDHDQDELVDDEDRSAATFTMPVNSNGYSELPNDSLNREQQIVLQSVRKMGL